MRVKPHALAIFTLVCLALLNIIPNHFIDEIAKISKAFIWDDFSHRSKYETLRKNFKAGGLKNVDVRMKFVCFLGLKTIQ